LCGDDETPGTNEIKGETFIKWILRHNLFVIPLDMENHWFRYHHLFKDLLQRKMKEIMSAGEIKRLHQKASEWFESQNLITESIHHALASEDPLRAARIIEENRDEEFIADRWFVVNRWLAMLPADIKHKRPKLLLTEAWIANLQHQIARVPMFLEKAETLLDGHTAEPSLLGELAFLRGYLIYWDGQAKRCRQYNEEAVSKLSGMKSPFLGEAELMLGLARTMEGQAELAVRTLVGRINEVDSSEDQLRSRLIASLVFIHLVCGDLLQARIEAQRLHLVAKKFSMRLTEAWSSYMLGCSYLHKGELKAALPHFTSAYAQRYVLEPIAALDALVGLALTQQLMGLDDKATETAGQLAAFAQELNVPQYMSMVHSCYARIALLQGDLKSADERARMINDMPSAGNLFMWLESPPTTRARVLIALGSKASLVEATDLLQTIRHVSESCRFTCQTIEVTILQALAFDRQGRTEEAMAFLEEALSLAGPGGWIRPFVEGGQPMAELLKRLSGSGHTGDYIEQILNAFESNDQAALADTSDSRALQERSFSKPSTGHFFSSKSIQPLAEPLTHREQDVLELLSGRLQNKEIAEELHISAITVKSHLRNIYQKLGVEKRRQAVEKARGLGILK
jgi:LuxR family maltose regulon positive regulatory protein